MLICYVSMYKMSEKIEPSINHDMFMWAYINTKVNILYIYISSGEYVAFEGL